MTTPDRLTTSTTPFRASTPRHIPGPPLPSKRWYLRGNEELRKGIGTVVLSLLMLWLIVLSFLFAIGVLSDTWRGLGRTFVVIAALALAWCTLFLRRGWFPPKGAVILGGDDE